MGSGQSGCQVAEELHLAGRDVFLACGRAGWAPRRINGHDLAWWLREAGSFDDRVEDLPEPAARVWGNVQASGHDGGHDLHYRTLHALGVTLLGRFLGADGHDARFATDLDASIAWGDERHGKIVGDFRKHALEAGLPWTDLEAPEPVDAEPLERIPLRELGAVVFAGGFRPDYESWVECPGAFDEWASRSTETAPAPSCRGCTSWACTSCGSASPRCSSVWARTPPSSPQQIARRPRAARKGACFYLRLG